MERAIEPSPRLLSRIGGALYLMIIAGGLFGEMFVRNRLIVPGDAASTASNIRSMESLWRASIAVELFMLVCGVALALILYVLLRPVSRDLALLAIFFNLVTIALEAASDSQHLLAALFPLGTARYLSAFSPEQLYAITSLSLRSHSYGFGVGLVFFGCECLVLGYLILKSGYLPKALGVLMQIAGLCYLTNSFSLLLAPSFASRLVPAILLPAFVGEASLCLWLLLKGVNVEKWRALAIPQTTRTAMADV